VHPPFHLTPENRAHDQHVARAAAWSRSDPAAVSAPTTARSPWLPKIAALLPVGLSLLATVAAHAADLTPSPPISPADLQFFETKIRPILVNDCYKCHSHQADKV
jgi:hypothetical protein